MQEWWLLIAVYSQSSLACSLSLLSQERAFTNRIWLKEILIAYWKSRTTFSLILKKCNRFFALSTILTSMVNTFVFSFRKTKLSNLDFFSKCFYNCMELQQGVSYCQDCTHFWVRCSNCSEVSGFICPWFLAAVFELRAWLTIISPWQKLDYLGYEKILYAILW